MARRVYLHIGVMKSATSYLQGLFEQNQHQLAEDGFFWCPDELRYEGVKEILGKQPGAPEPVSSSVRLVSALRRHPGDALISNEVLAGLGPRQIRKLVNAVAPAELWVVVSARDLARIIPSHWQTTVKNGRPETWAEFAAAVCADRPSETRESEADPEPEPPLAGSRDVNRWFWRRHDLPSIIERWAGAVPLERIALMTVPPGSSDMTIVASRFGAVVGVDVTGLEHPETRRNPTLGAHSVELLRRINASMAELALDDPDHRFERALGGALAEHADLEPTFALTQSQQEWVGRRARAMIDAIEQMGVSVVGELSDLVPSPTPNPAAVDPGDTSEAHLLSAASRGLVGLAPVFNELRVERNDLRRRVRLLETTIEPPDVSAAGS